MNRIQKRELVEQQRKIFEAGAQRVDRRTGSFTFLTWSFFLAPLIAVQEFLSSTLRPAAAEDENAGAAQAAAASHVGNNDSSAIDLSLDANHIHCRCDSDKPGVKKIFVRPEDESMAGEIVREIIEGTPMK